MYKCYYLKFTLIYFTKPLFQLQIIGNKKKYYFTFIVSIMFILKENQNVITKPV